MEQQFSLSWREFQGNLTSGCAHLLASGEFADVTLAMEGQLLKAHRLVLSICSPFFQRMFHANPCHHPIVVLKDISYNAMKDLLQFMYNGEVSVKQEDLTNLISTAETLEIKGLTNKLNNNQENNNEISNDFTQKPSNFIFNANNKDRVPDKVVYQNDEQQLELLNQLSKFASFKRKCDSLMSKTYDSENCIQPEKRTKLREKQILNRHKIVNSHKTLLPNKFSNKYRSELLTSEPIVQNQLPDKYFDDSANISNHQEVKSNGTAESHSNVDCDVKRESEEAESDCALDEPTPRINDLTNDASMDNGVEDLSTLPNNEQDGVNITNPESPSRHHSAPWPMSPQAGGDNKRLQPYLKHRIIPIPQKEYGKKKYPQKSCRYCWRAGRRRDTRFMCEQCCVPLCKLVCFERHLASFDTTAFADDTI